MLENSNFHKFLDEIILEVEKELEEETTTGDAAGYDIPGAFGAGRDMDKKKTKETATQAGYEVVNESIKDSVVKEEGYYFQIRTAQKNKAKEYLDKKYKKFYKWASNDVFFFPVTYDNDDKIHRMIQWLDEDLNDIGVDVIDQVMGGNNVNESQDGYSLHKLANNPGQDVADQFLSKYNVDLKLLTKAIQQGVINKYDLRDIVTGKAHKFKMKQFIKQFVNEGFPGNGSVVMRKDIDYDMLSYFDRMNKKLLINTKKKKGITGSVGQMYGNLVFNGDDIDLNDIVSVKIIEGKTEKDFELGTPAVFDGDSGEIVTNPKTQRAWTPSGKVIVSKGEKGLFLYKSKNFIVPDWSKTKPFNESVNESKKPKPKRKNRWLELKNDESMHGHKKLAVGLKELKYQLREVERFLGWYGKLKNINELDSDTYWKRTNTNIRNIKERIINIARKLQEIEK